MACPANNIPDNTPHCPTRHLTISIYSNGNPLDGDIYFIGAILYDSNGKDGTRFLGFCSPAKSETDAFAKKIFSCFSQTVYYYYETYINLCRVFAEWIQEHNALCIPYIVNDTAVAMSKLLLDARNEREMYCGEGSMLVDVGALCSASGLNLVTVTEKHDADEEGVIFDPKLFTGGELNPLYGAMQTEAKYRQLLDRLRE